MKSSDFLPIIIGTDINAYNMAISFHEEYNILPVLVGKVEMALTSYSNIIRKIEINPNLHEKKDFLKFMEEIARKYLKENKKLILIGTNDFYVRLITENADRLRKYYYFNYNTEELMNQLLVKENFYKLCEKHGLDIPTTHIHSCRDGEDFNEKLNYPVIIKPSNGVEYYRNEFQGQQKVYKVYSLKEAKEVIDKITNSGYRNNLIIQDFIPGDDTYMWDSVVYINTRGKAEIVTLGQVVLQEHTVTAIGNYTAIITRYNEEIMNKLKNFLEDINYRGFANFDFKYDTRDGKYKVFEVNIRQGRSSYYITQCGYNMAKLFIDDLIYKKEKDLVLLKDSFLFTVVPKIVLKKFVKNKDINRELRQLIKAKKYGNPLFYKKDTSFKRKIYLFLRQVNYYKKYSQNEWS